MKYKHVYAAHELRMWILTIGTLATATGAVLAKHPEVKETAINAFNRVTSKFKKEKPKERVIKIVIVSDKEV